MSLTKGTVAVAVSVLALCAPPAGATHRHLARGDAGPQVALWQRMLNMLPSAPELREDGIFGPLTERATRRFERSMDAGGIDGVVTTRDRILWLGGFLTGSGAAHPPLHVGSYEPRVGYLQLLLNRWARRSALAVEPLWIDNVYGVRTETAVRTFQTRSGLTPDGIAGPRTWDELYRQGYAGL
ncbi:MAG: peptidoglycan-binding protein [Actinomycetota bacterium]|nr:peptidoglycan-binding protein [Actinomycetota bacterium]